MGLGVYLTARLSRWRRHSLDDLTAWAGLLVLPPPLDTGAATERYDDGVERRLLALEEPVRFWLDGRTLHVEARTSTLGPGYHAALVASLDAMAVEAGLTWSEVEDDTGFFAARDVPALEHAYTTFFKNLCRGVLDIIEEEGTSGLAIQIALSARPVLEGRIATPLGPRDRGFFEHPDPRAHFPWWEQGLTPTVRERLAAALLWSHFPWRSPLDEEEEAIGALVLSLMQGQSSDLPLDEVRQIMAREEEAPPQPGAIGYRRGDITLRLPSGWQIDMPGHFWGEPEDEDGTMIYWFGPRAIRITTFRYDGRFEPQEILAGSDAEIRERHTDHVITADFTEDDEGDGRYILLSARIEAAGRSALVTVTLEGETADAVGRDWALRVVRRIQPPSPD